MRIDRIGSVNFSEIVNGIHPEYFEELIYMSDARERLLGVTESYKEYDVDINNDMGEEFKYSESMFIRVSKAYDFSDKSYYILQLNINAVDGEVYAIPDCIDGVGIICKSDTSIELKGDCEGIYIYDDGVKNFSIKIESEEDTSVIFQSEQRSSRGINIEINSKKDFSLLEIATRATNIKHKEATNGAVHTYICGRGIDYSINKLILGKGVTLSGCGIEVRNCIELLNGLSSTGIAYPVGTVITIEYNELMVGDEFDTYIVNLHIDELISKGFRQDMLEYLLKYRDDNNTYIEVK